MLNVDKFYCISICSNPVRYQTRWKLFKEYEKHITSLGAKLIIVEQAFGNRQFQLTERDNPFHIQVRTDHELWHKENMINIGIQQLSQIDPEWEYVAWVDGDLHFSRNDIILETAQQLQHYDIVQMFSHAIDLGPEQQFIQGYNGFMYSYHQNGCYPPLGIGKGKGSPNKNTVMDYEYYAIQGKKQEYWHPGFAWAARRIAIDKINLFDKAILGSGDHHMALALIGQAHRSVPENVSTAYRKAVFDWEKNATFAIQRNVGYVPGTIMHYWHGAKVNRKYSQRWEILKNNQFDPVADLIKDSFGLHRLNMCHGERSIRLRDEIRRYFRERNEDCTYFPGPHRT
jgi:hypothetical protein